jgi:hypothetical protein
MKKLARAMLSVMVELHGPNKVVEMFADPVWFQAFNNAIGMDWDSSGSTTVTTGIVKQILTENPDMGLLVAGGKGSKAREAARELESNADRYGISESLKREAVYASRLAAKTDSVLLQDGYTLYHHAVFVSSEGAWAIVQQGMNVSTRFARRYHWLAPLDRSHPTLEPHAAISSNSRERFVVDLTSRVSLDARKLIVDLAKESPQKAVRLVMEAYRALRGDTTIELWLRPNQASGTNSDRLRRELLRYYRSQERPPRHIERVLRTIYDAAPKTLEELVLVEGVGPAVVRSLALVAELIYEAPVNHDDPAKWPLDPFRYAYVVGGKDGVPFPFRRDYAEKVIEFLENVLAEARIDDKHKRRALERLRRLASLLKS